MSANINEKQGNPAQLNKLVELNSSAVVKLVESTDASGVSRVMVRGEFGRADKATANKRLYPHSLWESQITRLKDKMGARKVLGELDHPDDGRTSLQRVSHVMTSLTLDGDIVIGEAEILDTAKGRDLKAILSAGVPVGVSSRGYGSTKPNAKGEEGVQEDFNLVTFDFVAEPADSTAYPDVFFEGVEIPTASLVEASTAALDAEQALAKKFGQMVLSDAEAAEAKA